MKLQGFMNGLEPDQRQALLERLAVAIQQAGKRAGDEGDFSLENLMCSLAASIAEEAESLSFSDLNLANEVASKAIKLLLGFKSRHPFDAVHPRLH